MEIVLILGVALLLFGAGRIADIGKGLGEGIRNFKKGIKDDEPAPAKLPPKKEEAATTAETGARSEDQKV